MYDEYYNNNGSTVDSGEKSVADEKPGYTGHGPTDENPTYRYVRNDRVYTETNRMNMDHIPEEPAVRRKKKGGFGAFVKKSLVAVFCGLLFGVFAGTGIYAVNVFTDNFGKATVVGEAIFGEDEQEPEEIAEEIAPSAPVIGAVPLTPSYEVPMQAAYDASAVVEKCMPSIVSITNKYTETYQSFWGQSQQYQNEASGSGIIVGENEEELLIVTNSHVVNGTDQLTVQFVDGTTCDAEIKGSKSDQDIAVIAVKLTDLSDDTMKAITIATIGDSDALKVGQPVIAIGNALGYGQSVTSGIVSALNRDFTTKNMIQTDAAINPGNSGGALLNMNGELIGINEAKASATSIEGVGYAIPISTAEPIINDLATKTTRSKVDEKNASFLGIAGVDVTDQIANTYGMPVGVYVAQVTEGSAAEAAGLVKGDIITEFDGETVTSMEELKKVMEYYAAGTKVELKIQKMGDEGYTEKTISVVLGKRED